ncbi:Predicted Fe-Mo cluster-binding protein, NifX family [Mariniphaga anaerophila]|uniref:Predicted Fe-Mo cluster-binding protein, NifX family n=1 Tax=Mariniphaga anaerophila TaxID=1484053 RepID=A0A1M4WB29_9BACT|nr:NifB/NifX family molybdenum-iron cluster-binding protein [Mariniphaga anaerophila]SHE78375.1 Predicted Fe-Mo cluster-binding protein, NifX family [Mariniphaga anaerophila]
MKKRVAIPVTNGQLSEYFGECNHYEIFEIDGKLVGKKEERFPAGTVAAELPEWLEKKGITDVIVYRVNSKIIKLFASKKVNLFVGVPIDSPQKLIENYLQGKLESDEKIIREITYSTI